MDKKTEEIIRQFASDVVDKIEGKRPDAVAPPGLPAQPLKTSRPKAPPSQPTLSPKQPRELSIKSRMFLGRLWSRVFLIVWLIVEVFVAAGHGVGPAMIVAFIFVLGTAFGQQATIAGKTLKMLEERDKKEIDGDVALIDIARQFGKTASVKDEDVIKAIGKVMPDFKAEEPIKPMPPTSYGTMPGLDLKSIPAEIGRFMSSKFMPDKTGIQKPPEKFTDQFKDVPLEELAERLGVEPPDDKSKEDLSDFDRMFNDMPPNVKKWYEKQWGEHNKSSDDD